MSRSVVYLLKELLCGVIGHNPCFRTDEFALLLYKGPLHQCRRCLKVLGALPEPQKVKRRGGKYVQLR